MSTYIFYLLWIIIILCFGIYWHVMRMGQTLRKMHEEHKSTESSE